MWAGTAASSVRRHSSPVSTTPWQCLILFFCFSFCIMCCTLFWLFNSYYFSDIVRIPLLFSVCVAKDRVVIRECMETWMCHLAQRPKRRLSDAFVQSPAASRNFFFLLKGSYDVYKCSARVLRSVLFPFNVRHLQLVCVCVYCISGKHFLAARAGLSFPYLADIVLFTLELCKTQHFVYCDLTTGWHGVKIKWDSCCLTFLISWGLWCPLF